jgi:hypothetical protein
MSDTLKIFIENNREGFKETPPENLWGHIEKGLKQNNNLLKTKKLSTMLKYGFGASVLIVGTVAIMNLKNKNTNIFNNTIAETTSSASSEITQAASDVKNSSVPVAVNTSTNPVKLNSQSTKANHLIENKVIAPDTLDVTAWRMMGSAIDSYSIWGDYSTGKNIGVIKSKEKKIEGFCGFMLSTMPDEYNGLSSLPDKYLGKRVRLTGYCKTENVEEWAGLWLRVGKKGGDEALGFDNMRYGKKDRSIKGTTPWTKYEVVLDVPMNASNILYGVMIAGTGEIRWHTCVLEIVDDSVPVTADVQSSYPGILQKDRYRSYHPKDFWKWYVPRRKILKDGTSQVDYTE